VDDEVWSSDTAAGSFSTPEWLKVNVIVDN
jgi:hypothetical protein